MSPMSVNFLIMREKWETILIVAILAVLIAVTLVSLWQFWVIEGSAGSLRCRTGGWLMLSASVLACRQLGRRRLYLCFGVSRAKPVR